MLTLYTDYLDLQYLDPLHPEDLLDHELRLLLQVVQLPGRL